MDDLYLPHPLHCNYASNVQGAIINIKLQRKVKGRKLATGYWAVQLQTTPNKQHFVHRFVYECFHGVLVPKLQVHHIDANKNNNRLLNLQAMDIKAHCAATTLMNPSRHSKTAQARSIPVLRTSMDGSQMVFPSLHEAASATPGALVSGISHCVRSKRHIHVNCTWTYVDENNIPGEVWASPIESSLKGLEVSSEGRMKIGHRVFSGYDHGSYKRVTYKKKHIMVHTIICRAFHGYPPSKDCSVDHINRLPTDNRATNLRWASRSEQSRNKANLVQVTGTTETGEKRTWETLHDACRDIGCTRPHKRYLTEGRWCNGVFLRLALQDQNQSL